MTVTPPPASRRGDGTPTTVLVLDGDVCRGAVLRRDGRETPITDDMVKRACVALEHHRFPFRHCPETRPFSPVYQ